MTARIIDGKAIALNIRKNIKLEVDELNSSPVLAVILVGEDPASQVYVRNKIKATEKCGMISLEKRLSKDVTNQEIADTINELNNDDSVNGILLQLPIPDHLSSVQEELVQMINPEKDVDGLTVTNAGKLFLGMDDGLVPCTPQGSLALIKSVKDDLSGLKALVIGRSNLFGKPMSQLLLKENCTVTTAHSRTKNLDELCKNADILIAAIGRPEIIKGENIKKGAIVIDVGINRIEIDGKTKLVGDVEFDEAKNNAGSITPVPGGVGPMTIAYLLQNTLKSYKSK